MGTIISSYERERGEEGKHLRSASLQLQCVPRKGFRSSVCGQKNREIVYIASQSADPNPFEGRPDP